MKKLDFRVRVEVDPQTGRTLAVYLRVRQGRAAEVVELEDGNAFADYDRNGWLLGVELLAPCRVAVFDRLTKKEPKLVREFFHRTVPQEMAIGA